MVGWENFHSLWLNADKAHRISSFFIFISVMCRLLYHVIPPFSLTEWLHPSDEVASSPTKRETSVCCTCAPSSLLFLSLSWFLSRQFFIASSSSSYGFEGKFGFPSCCCFYTYNVALILHWWGDTTQVFLIFCVRERGFSSFSSVNSLTATAQSENSFSHIAPTLATFRTQSSLAALSLLVNIGISNTKFILKSMEIEQRTEWRQNDTAARDWESARWKFD